MLPQSPFIALQHARSSGERDSFRSIHRSAGADVHMKSKRTINMERVLAIT